MPDVLAFSSGDYAVEIALREPPLAYPSLAEPGLREDFGLSESGTLLVVTAGRADADHRSVIVSQHFYPGPEVGFQPGVLIVPETDALFIAAGTRLLAYDLETAERLWQDEADTGFWFWRRHGNFILMSAELEFAAWNLEAEKLWSTFVEPPWTYSVEEDRVTLDVMGELRRFPIRLGPRSQR
jgi:hypothetical protein